MARVDGGGIGLDELKRAVREADPAAVLVPQRILRRAIKLDRTMTSLGLQVPHRKTYVLDAAAAITILEPDELGLERAAEASLSGPVILLAEPEPEAMESATVGRTLLRYWRLLFHARVDLAIEGRFRDGSLSPAALRDRIDRIGQAAFDEARAVLRHEDFLLPPRDHREAYREFAAVYLELRAFASDLLPLYFPSIEDRAAVEAVLSQDVDADRLFEETRLPGAPMPMANRLPAAPRGSHLAMPPEPEGAHGLMMNPVESTGIDPSREAIGTCPLPAPEPALRRVETLSRRADRASRRGNVVRAAILRARASRFLDPLGPPSARAPWAGALGELSRLADRVGQALELDRTQADAWRSLLPALLAPASEGIWAVEARLLFDLQKLCVDYERPIYTVDLVEWMLTRGRRPIKRLLPFQRELLAVKHLRSAHRRLHAARISEPARDRLEELIAAALHRAETTLRDRCRTPIAETLRDTGFRPRNVAEQVSFDKIVEELLDKVVAQAFLTMGDLRDAVARNHVKLPDLAGSREFFKGDRLLQANRSMAVSLDGIYRRGEVYLRWLQRFSSLGFGTVAGRFLTQYVILPFGGAFVVLVFIDHLFAVITGSLGYGLEEPNPGTAHPPPADVAVAAATLDDGSAIGQDADHPPIDPVEPNPDAEVEAEAPPVVDAEIVAETGDMNMAEPSADEMAEAAAAHEVGGVHLIPHETWPWVWVTLVAGAFVFGLIHVPRFRKLVVTVIRAVYDLIKGLIVDLPHWLLQRPFARRIIETRAFQFLWRMLVKPVAPALLVWIVLLMLGFGLAQASETALLIFLIVALLLNLRVGRDMEEIASDHLVRTWRLIRVNIIIGMYQLIVDLFGGLLENVDRLLYTVDEWLRFRGGQSRITYAVKAVLGVFWFYITYTVRFIINLLVEPQINPIKHFPVVTVSHKVLAPILILMIPPLSRALDDKELATTIWFFTQLLLPGVFGFLVWELKENWRLYDANRPETLPRVLIGSHGETMTRLLRPGLHSGTLPRLYARLRRAGRRATRRPDGKGRVRRLAEERHHVEEAVAHFVERELLNLLARTRGWGDVEVEIAAVESSTNRVRVDLRCPSLGDEPLGLIFEHASGWILAGVAAPPWLDRLSDDRRRVLQAALAGLDQMACVDLVRSQVEHLLPPQVHSYGFTDAGLIVWVGDAYETEAVYDLESYPRTYPYVVSGPRPVPPLPALETSRLILSRHRIAWTRWVETWEAEQDRQPPPEPFTKGMCLPGAVPSPTPLRADRSEAHA